MSSVSVPVGLVQVGVRRDRSQSRILDRHPNREVVETLEAIAGEAEHLVAGVVEVAANAGAA